MIYRRGSQLILNGNVVLDVLVCGEFRIRFVPKDVKAFKAVWKAHKETLKAEGLHIFMKTTVTAPEWHIVMRKEIYESLPKEAQHDTQEPA